LSEEGYSDGGIGKEAERKEDAAVPIDFGGSGKFCY